MCHRSQSIIYCACKGKVAADTRELNVRDARGAGRVLIIRFRKSGTVPFSGSAGTLGEILGDEQKAFQKRSASGRPSLNRDVDKLLVINLSRSTGAYTDHGSDRLRVHAVYPDKHGLSLLFCLIFRKT